ncbi:MAG: iron-sulfur cluster assembly scaffold protein [Thermodesulfobacteriota bacterium]|nr:iron-sulfur cluster assembly scaffold protein [Thermodesulfobacteriota bacterium]
MYTAAYNEKVIDHFTNPRNVGEMSAKEATGFAIDKALDDPVLAQARQTNHKEN